MIGLTEAREWSNVLSTTETDSVVQTIIDSAISRAEAYLNRAIELQTRCTTTSIPPPTSLYLEPFESLTVERVRLDGSVVDVTSRYRTLPRSGVVQPSAEFPYGADDQFRFTYVCGWIRRRYLRRSGSLSWASLGR